MSETATTVESRKHSSAKELARMKQSLGEILLALQCSLTTKERHDLWERFALLLERYVEEKRKR